jgi:hypothetical protein
MAQVEDTQSGNKLGKINTVEEYYSDDKKIDHRF